jgi:hypothetical protein
MAISCQVPDLYGDGKQVPDANLAHDARIHGGTLALARTERAVYIHAACKRRRGTTWDIRGQTGYLGGPGEGGGGGRTAAHCNTSYHP